MSALNPDSLTQLLCDLVAIPSINPAFHALESSQSGESRMVEFLAEKARNLGLYVEFQDVAQGRQNVLISLPARQQPARHTIGLMPHLDTVSVSESWQLQPEIRDGKLYGRGACDTKGSRRRHVPGHCRCRQHHPGTR
ncbi:MAG: M20/M25/M40 family metallo-hydrolase [Verrucomicrobia bacterium]|nr:M20/M25/M40 family metallo-hydrolase [Verrucomicrobiota bacterium]